jgi:hypothetical protein
VSCVDLPTCGGVLNVLAVLPHVFLLHLATGSSMKPAGAKGAAGAAALQQQAAAEAAAAAAAALAIPAGQLRVQLSLPADVATRDWLRTGAASTSLQTGG